MKQIKYLFFVGFAFLMGCETTTYSYKPPASEQGRMCVTQCAANRELCSSNETQKANNQNSSCRDKNDAIMRDCLSRAKTKKERNKCTDAAPTCGGGFVDEEKCEVKYRECYTNCGGVVEAHIEK